jgi:hypothetical protein
MGKLGPFRARYERAEVALHGVGIDIYGETQPPRKAANVRVDRYSGHAKRVAKDDVCGLSADAPQGDEVIEAGRDFPPKALHECAAEFEQRLGLGVEESRRADEGFEPFAGGGGESLGVGERGEQRGRDRVDLDIRALRGEDGGNGQFEGVPVVEFAPSVRILVREHPIHPPSPPHQGRVRTCGACDGDRKWREQGHAASLGDPQALAR